MADRSSGYKPFSSFPAGQDLHERIESDFTYHAPTPQQIPVYEELRSRAREFAHFLVDVVPPGRELGSALTALETAVFHANAGVARHTSAPPAPVVGDIEDDEDPE